MGRYRIWELVEYGNAGLSRRIDKNKYDSERTVDSRQEDKEMQCRVKRGVAKAGIFVNNFFI